MTIMMGVSHTRNMLIEHHREKMINAIIYFVTKTKFCGIAKLCWLMYYLDFLHFKETGMSVTDMDDYLAGKFGPVPSSLHRELSNDALNPDMKENISIRTANNFKVIQAIKEFDNQYFTKRELRILEKVALLFHEVKVRDMVDEAHLPNHPWDTTIQNEGLWAKIDYMLALDGSSESISKEEALERIADREEMKKVFSG
ncbi:MAG: SocA family protein [Nitrospirae bacterium]|nr:SocA family protein [Nitrospirota bacterium]